MKKVFIGVLAALMLFAFTACEPQTITWPTEKDITYVSVEQTATYIVGETATGNGFNIVVNYTEGESTIIPGAANVKVNGGVASVEGLTFKNANDVVVPVVPCNVEYKAITSATITGVSNVTIEDGTKLEDSNFASNIKLDGAENLTLTLAFDGGERVYTADDIVAKKDVTATNGKINVVLSLVDKDGNVLPTSTAVKKGETYTVTLDNYYLGTDWAYEKNLSKGFETGVTVNVVKTDTTEVVTGIQAKYTVTRDSKPVVTDVTSLAGVDLFIKDKVVITLYNVATTAGQDTSDKLTSGYEYVDDNSTTPDIVFKDGVSQSTLEVKATEQSGTAYYRIANHGTEFVDISIPAGKNAVVMQGTSITVSQKNVTYAEGLLSGGTDITQYVQFGSNAGLKNLNGENEVEYTVTVDPARSYNITTTGQEIWVFVNYDSYEGTVNYPTTVKGFKAQTV